MARISSSVPSSAAAVAVRTTDGEPPLNGVSNETGTVADPSAAAVIGEELQFAAGVAPEAKSP